MKKIKVDKTIVNSDTAQYSLSETITQSFKIFSEKELNTLTRRISKKYYPLITFYSRLAIALFLVVIVALIIGFNFQINPIQLIIESNEKIYNLSGLARIMAIGLFLVELIVTATITSLIVFYTYYLYGFFKEQQLLVKQQGFIGYSWIINHSEFNSTFYKFKSMSNIHCKQLSDIFEAYPELIDIKKMIIAEHRPFTNYEFDQLYAYHVKVKQAETLLLQKTAAVTKYSEKEYCNSLYLA